MGSPAPVWLSWPKEEETLGPAAGRFQIEVRGQVFRDFVELGRTKGRGEAESLEQWRAWEGVVLANGE